MIREFGGLQDFCRLLKETCDQAANQGRIATAAKLLIAVSRLVLVAHDFRSREKSTVSKLTKEEFESAAKELFGPIHGSGSQADSQCT